MGHRRIFAIAIVLFASAYSGTTFAQPKARKFHELVLGAGTFISDRAGWEASEEELKFHMPRYAKQLRREDANAYIIG
jgi:hypothetical protein